MKIVLDETLGLESLECEHISIKPITIKGADDLRSFLDKNDSTFLRSKKVPFSDWQLEEEITYFVDRFPKGSRIIYFYDPHVQPSDELKKLTNWLMNERCVIPIAAPNNRAQLFMLIEKVQSLPNSTKQEVLRSVKMLTRSVSGTVISQKPTVFSNEKMLRTYRAPKKDIYKRAVWKNEKLSVEESGNLLEISEGVTPSNDDFECWVVRKGVSHSLGANREIEIAKTHLPINISFIHIARIPITNRWGESND